MERWLNSKPNPYVNKNAKVGWKIQKGKTVHLFADDDRDGVPNVFDCSPKNKRKQDVLSPMSGGSPVQEMYGRRESQRQQLEYQRAIERWEREHPWKPS